MELFILGPAFGLPSIHAECLAAVALLKLHFADEEWSLTPTHEQAQNLPYLVTSARRIQGFQNIARHLAKTQIHETPLSAADRASTTAILSLLSSRAQLLLDISLYVSYENYTTTRTAFTQILPWHANYTLPPTLRAAARNRTAHLGVAALDLDDVHEDLSNKPAGMNAGREPLFEAETQKRASLLLGGKKTVRSLLQQRPEHAAVFKLHALADECLGSLEAWLGHDSDFFSGREEPAALDCAVYGYLALMLFPQLPQDWLATLLKRKYRRLVRFTEMMHRRLELETDVQVVMRLANCASSEEAATLRATSGSRLPWQRPARSSAAEVVKGIATDMFSRIPILGSSTVVVPVTPTKTTAWGRNLPVILGTATTCFGILGYYLFTTGTVVWPHGEDIHHFGKKRLSDYGHLGAALAGVSLLSQHSGTGAGYHGQAKVETPVHVKVEVEKDG